MCTDEPLEVALGRYKTGIKRSGSQPLVLSPGPLPLLGPQIQSSMELHQQQATISGDSLGVSPEHSLNATPSGHQSHVQLSESTGL